MATLEREVVAVSSATPVRDGTPMSYEEYSRLPEDSRTEYLAGRVMMAAVPTGRHQLVAVRLANLMADAHPELLAIVHWAWKVDDRNEPVPDVMLIPRSTDLSRNQVLTTPALAVEILSSHRARDLVQKPALYARGGLSYYWIVDLGEPSVAAFDLRNGEMKEVGVATAGVPAELPFAGGRVLVDVDGLMA